MANLPAYPDRFSFGRIFADIGRVVVRACAPLALGIAVLAIAPVVITAQPWSHGRAADPAFRLLWVAVAMTKTSINLIALAVEAVLITGLSLQALTAAAWRTLGWHALIGGLVTALCVGLMVNWPAFLTPLLIFVPRFAGLSWMVWLAVLVSQLLVSVSASVAVSAAIAERRFVGSAIARSFNLLRGLRWRLVAIGFATLFAAAIGQGVIAAALHAAGVATYGLGLGRAILNVAVVVIGAPFQIGFVSAFLQARRIADGPDAQELHDVFA